MLYVKVLPPVLKNDEVHTRTIVEVSDKPDFSNLIIEDDRDTELLTRVYNVSLVTNVKYYIRVRFYLEPGGFQGWSDVRIFNVTDTKDIELLITPPIYPDIPEITTTISGNSFLPIKYLRFNINVSRDIESRLKMINWFVFDIYNNLIYSLTDSSGKLNYIYLKKVLEFNKVYVIKASITTITNTTSDFTAFIFRTQKQNTLVIDDSVSYTVDGAIVSFNINTVDSYELEVYNLKNDLIYKVSSSGNVIDTSVFNLDIDEIAFIRIRESGLFYWDYVYREFRGSSTNLPFQLPTQI